MDSLRVSRLLVVCGLFVLGECLIDSQPWIEINTAGVQKVLRSMSADGKSPNNAGSCPKGFVPFQDSCYWFSRVHASYAEARSYCGALNSHLAVITCAEEDDFLRNKLKQITGRHFIGATDLASEGTWVWEGGSNMTYSNWYPGKPDNQPFEADTSDCLEMNDAFGYKWNDAGCGINQRFICETSRTADTSH